MSNFFTNLVKHDSPSDFYTLGIDIGTTSIKAVITHSTSAQPPTATPPPNIAPSFTHTILSHHTTDHLATLPSHAHNPHPTTPHAAPTSEQDTTKLLLAIQAAVRALPADYRRKVEYVGVSTQMHGVVLWHDRSAVPYATALFGQSSGAVPTFSLPQPHSQFIDWRDGRCGAAFLSTLNGALPLPSPVHPLQSGKFLHTGYGIASLAHIAANNPAFFAQYTRAGTIGDYLVWLLMNVRDDTTTASRSIAYPSYMHPSNAAAWGCFDIDKMQWEIDRIAAMRVPSSLLPTVMQSSPLFPLTPLMCQFLGVSPTAHTAVSVGDAQASVYAVQPTPRQLVLYIGTSAQVSLLVDEKDNEQADEEDGGDVEMDGVERHGEPSVALDEMERPEAYGEPSVSVAPSANTRGEGEESVLEPQGRAVSFAAPLPRAYSASSTGAPVPPASPSAAPRLPTCEYRPYLTGEKLLVCASLTGGNAFEWLARALQSLHTQLSTPSPLSPTALLQAQAQTPAFSYSIPASASSSSPHSSSSSSRHEHPLSYYYTILLRNGYHYMALPPAVRFHPTFFSERSSAPTSSPPHAQLTFLSSHITALSPGSLASALSLGIVENLHLLLTASLGGVERDRLRRVEELVCVGGAVRRNGMLRVYAEKVFGKRAVVAAGMRVAAGPVGGGGGGGGGSEGGKGGGGRVVDVEEEGSEDVSMYWPDAAFGAAVFGLQRLWEARVKTLVANKAMHL